MSDDHELFCRIPSDNPVFGDRFEPFTGPTAEDILGMIRESQQHYEAAKNLGADKQEIDEANAVVEALDSLAFDVARCIREAGQ